MTKTATAKKTTTIALPEQPAVGKPPKTPMEARLRLAGISISDVAREAGVTPQSATRAIRGEDTSAPVLKAAARLYSLAKGRVVTVDEFCASIEVGE